METFDFPYHKVSTEYPEGISVQFGNSYEYTIKPDAPDQRRFKLDFPTMVYFTDANGNVDDSHQPQINMLALEKFYQRHRQWKSFVYPHPVHGNIRVRFRKPLKVPEGTSNGNGAVANFTVELIEKP